MLARVVGNISRARRLIFLCQDCLVDIAVMGDGTLEFVANSDFMTILPAIMMTPEIENAELCVRPIRKPKVDLELISIEPGSRDQSLIAPLLRDGFSQQIADFNCDLDEHCKS